MWEDPDLGAAEPCPVDDARVVELVRDDQVSLPEKRGDRPRVRREAALEHDRGLGLLEGGDTPLQLQMERHRARDRPNRARAHAERADGLDGRLLELRMGRQPEIVVRGEIDDLASVEPRPRKLLPFEHAERPVQTVALQLSDRVFQVMERAFGGG